MCGRYTLRRVSLARAVLEATPTFPFEEFSEQVRYNVAPSQLVPVARMDEQGKRVLDLARWGFIPAWAKSPPKFQPINARAETLATSGMFRTAFDRRRCLIPADGFYEWKADAGKKSKQPYFIHFTDDRPFAFAGLWERWKADEKAEPVETCTIVTTTPNHFMEPIHNRMPAIIQPADFERWLDPKVSGTAVRDLLAPIEADDLEAYPVETRVNRPTNDGPALIERA